MSDDPGHDAGAPDDGGWDATDAPTTGSTPRVQEPVPHSRLVGFMAEPMARWVPFRRSTVLMAVAFLGFGTLCYLYPPNAGSTSTGTTSGGSVIPGVFVPASTTTTTTTRPPATTTTTRPVGSTSTTTTTRPTTTTTTTRPVGPTTTTTTVPQGTTTTTVGAATTTTVAP